MYLCCLKMGISKYVILKLIYSSELEEGDEIKMKYLFVFCGLIFY